MSLSSTRKGYGSGVWIRGMDHAVSWGMDQGMDRGVWIVCGSGALIHTLYFDSYPYYIILYYIILYYIILYCIILYYVILYYTILYYIYYTIYYDIYYIIYYIIYHITYYVISYYIIHYIVLYITYYILYIIYYILYIIYYILYIIYYIYHIMRYSVILEYAFFQLCSWTRTQLYLEYAPISCSCVFSPFELSTYHPYCSINGHKWSFFNFSPH